jgi:hypothetical protein
MSAFMQKFDALAERLGVTREALQRMSVITVLALNEARRRAANVPAPTPLECPDCNGFGTFAKHAGPEGGDKPGADCPTCKGTGHARCEMTGCTGVAVVRDEVAMCARCAAVQADYVAKLDAALASERDTLPDLSQVVAAVAE